MRTLFLVGLAVLLGASVAEAQGLGVGIIAGEPTGLTFKGSSGNGRAIDVAAGWSLGHDHGLLIRSNLILGSRPFVVDSRCDSRLYYGIGGGFRWQESGVPRLGARLPVGSSFMFGSRPVELFAELDTIMCVFPKTDLLLRGAVGMRLYFRGR